jgi:hypothetical protein
MVKMKSLCNFRFLLLALIPCLLFGALAAFSRNIKDIEFLSSAVSDGETTESGGTAFFVSENLLLCGRTPAQSRTQSNRLWRQVLSFVLFVLFLMVFSSVMLREYYLHNYSARKFFHTLVNSFLLGGRAPPFSAYFSF